MGHIESLKRWRPVGRVGAGAFALFTTLLIASCGSSPDSTFPGSNPAGALGPDGGSGSLGGQGGSGAVNPPGSPCPTAGQTAPCWTGSAAQRNVGTCHDGTTTCQQVSVESNVWGPCQGEVLACGDAGGGGGGGTGTGGGGSEDGGNGTGGGGGECVAPDSQDRCPPGTYGDVRTNKCCPCTANDCGDQTKVACCTASVCASSSACSYCTGQGLDPACNGRIDKDCDNWPEDCDQLCCPCKPAGICVNCPSGQIPCNGNQGGTSLSDCVNAVSDPNHCGACDRTCSGACVSGTCQ